VRDPVVSSEQRKVLDDQQTANNAPRTYNACTAQELEEL
jgi:hypothetical protein